MSQNKSHYFSKAISLALASLVLFSFSLPALADQFDDQISALKQEAAVANSQANAYNAQAQDYQSRVNQLNAQNAAIQAQINLNQAKYDKLTAEIADNTQKLAAQKDLLDENIRQIYQEGQVSTLEMLVSSDGFSAYLDKQQALQNVKDKIADSVASIKALKAQLESDQQQTVSILADERAQRQQITSQEAEASSLLSLASQNVDAANQQVRNDNTKIASLRAQQAAILAANSRSYSGGSFGGSGGACDNGHGNGGYPSSWCNAAQDAAGYGGPWGYNRECVSWAGFRRGAIGRPIPGGWGNANQWASSARAAGYRVDGTPEVGAIAQTSAGYFGHVAVVEAIQGASVVVSEMNYDNDGHFRLGLYSASYFNYIH